MGRGELGTAVSNRFELDPIGDAGPFSALSITGRLRDKILIVGAFRRWRFIGYWKKLL